MSKKKLILEAVKTALTEGKATVNLKEASALTGSGSGVGGRLKIEDAFAPLRMANPFRLAGARTQTTTASNEGFVAKTGNITNIQTSTDNPWGYYPINNNNATSGENTAFWQLPVQAIQAQVPIREAVLNDIENLNQAVVSDIAMEFAQQEALSMQLNNDQAGSTTYNYGATYGLRGLDSYAGSTSAASFGTSGPALTNGLHTMLQVQQNSSSSISYNDIENLSSALPPQFWMDPTTAYMMHPTTIQNLREMLTSGSNIPYFLETGQFAGGAVTKINGFPVIPNPYMSLAGSGNYPIYLAAWGQFMSIADYEMMSIQTFEQTTPGFMTLFCEKRVCSTILNVFAGVRLVG